MVTTNVTRTAVAERPMKDQPVTPEGMQGDSEFKRVLDDRAWDAIVGAETLFDPRQPQLKKREMTVRAHLLRHTGRSFQIGFFTERDIPDRQKMGWLPITKTSLPGDAFDEAFLALSGLNYAPADSTFRTGKVNELILCWIRSDVRERLTAQLQAATRAEEQKWLTSREGKFDHKGGQLRTIESSVTCALEPIKVAEAVKDAARDLKDATAAAAASKPANQKG